MNVGIIGLGQFGMLMAETLARDAQLQVSAFDIADIEPPKGVEKTDLNAVAQTDALLLCVPLPAYDSLCKELEPMLARDCLIVDVASVKTEAALRLHKRLPNHRNFLMTHPIFGPLYAKSGLQGLRLVVTRSEGERASKAIEYCRGKLGLEIIRMTSEEHDREMAEVHALTYLIGRGLTKLNLQESKVSTPTFRMLHEIMRYDKAHSEELFRTIQLGNPFAKSAREKFVKTLVEINDELDKETI